MPRALGPRFRGRFSGMSVYLAARAGWQRAENAAGPLADGERRMLWAHKKMDVQMLARNSGLLSVVHEAGGSVINASNMSFDRG